jgi:predicted O-methyltransferase YrrM
VVALGSFSEDWFTMHISHWETVLRELQGRTASVLELGSFEGLSACFLLWRLRDAQITCVDTFTGIPEYAAYGISSQLEDAFDRNVALVDASRVRKLVGETHRVLSELAAEQAQFDLVYVDASHQALDVLADAALSWKLLKEDGIAIFDDYGPLPFGEDPLLYPTPAIDAFLGLVTDRHEVVDDLRQLIVRKTG